MLEQPETDLDAVGEDLDLTEFAEEIDPPVFLGNGESNTVHRLREGIERFLITDINNQGASAKAQSDIWIYLDKLSTESSEMNHVPGGSNVLYLDGHVQFIRYGTDDPVTPGVARLWERMF
jgi:prepilin-type processing-associated H-X9-DG protein